MSYSLKYIHFDCGDDNSEKQQSMTYTVTMVVETKHFKIRMYIFVCRKAHDSHNTQSNIKSNPVNTCKCHK